MRRLILAFIVLASVFAMPAQAQKVTLVDLLEQDVPGEGKVTIEADARLDSLIGYVSDSDTPLKAIGFRIQVFAGNNTRDARSSALQAESFIRENYPDLPVYTLFKSPRWLCVVGDFLTYEAAYEVMRQLKHDTPYKGMIILRNQEIKISL